MTERKTVEIVEKEINYVEHSFNMRFPNKESLEEGVKFLNETVKDWTDDGRIKHRTAIIDVHDDELYIKVTMRIEGREEIDESEEDVPL